MVQEAEETEAANEDEQEESEDMRDDNEEVKEVAKKPRNRKAVSVDERVNKLSSSSRWAFSGIMASAMKLNKLKFQPAGSTKVVC